MSDFNVLSFKIGLCVSFQWLIAARQLHYLKRSAFWGRIPGIISILWGLTGLTWILYLYYRYQYYVFAALSGTLSCILDTCTKGLLVYYTGIRLIVLIRIQRSLRWITYILIASGVFVCAVCNIVLAIGCWQPFDARLSTQTSYVYLSADIYISICGLVSFYMYVKYKFNVDDYKQVWRLIRSLKLTDTVIVLVVFFILSVLITIIGPEIIDPDLLYYCCISAVKYASECDLAISMFQKTSGVPSKKDGHRERASAESLSGKDFRLTTPPAAVAGVPGRSGGAHTTIAGTALAEWTEDADQKFYMFQDTEFSAMSPQPLVEKQFEMAGEVVVK